MDGDRYLLELIRYIHLNPVRAGMVEAPEDYPWSGHRAYLGKEVLLWLTTDWMLGQFGKSAARARDRYISFIRDGLGEEHRPEFHGKGGEDSRLLGDDSFVDKCLSGSDGIPLRLTAREIVEKVCRVYDLEEAELKTQSQSRNTSEARAVAGWLARELGCATLSDIAKLVNRDVGSISSAVRRLSNRMQQTRDIAERMRSLKAELEAT